MSAGIIRIGKRGLAFSDLRAANRARLPLFKNAKGEPAHSQPDGSDWSLAEWMNAVLGELGEAANIVKKVQRGDLTIEEARPLLATEFADVVTYLDIAAFRAGVDLGAATADKFNVVSRRVGAAILLEHDSDADDDLSTCGNCDAPLQDTLPRYVCRDGDPQYCEDCAPTWGEDLVDAEEAAASPDADDYDRNRLASLKRRLDAGEIRAGDRAVWS